jgi:hypothetical protein
MRTDGSGGTGVLALRQAGRIRAGELDGFGLVRQLVISSLRHGPKGTMERADLGGWLAPPKLWHCVHTGPISVVAIALRRMPHGWAARAARGHISTQPRDFQPPRQQPWGCCTRCCIRWHFGLHARPVSPCLGLPTVQSPAACTHSGHQSPVEWGVLDVSDPHPQRRAEYPRSPRAFRSPGAVTSPAGGTRSQGDWGGHLGG